MCSTILSSNLRDIAMCNDDPSHGYLIDHRAALAVRAVTGDTNTARAFREALNARDAGNAEGDDHAHAN